MLNNGLMIALRTVKNRTPAFEALFGEGVRRRLLVVLDTDTVDLDADGTNHSTLMAGLLGHDDIEVYRFSDGGVPESARTLDTEYWGSAPIGWLQVTPDEQPHALRSHGLRWSDGNSIRDAAVGGDMIPAIAMRIAQVRGEEPIFEGTPDALLVAAAEEIGADILITRRHGLHALRSNFVRGLTIVDIADAVSLGGLFLRSRGKYLGVISPRFTQEFNKASFFEASALLFLPHQLEVLDRSQLLATERDEPDAAGLAGAAFRRISRSIERRDQVWRLISQPQDIDIAEDMLAIYEALLASLMGAIDATARLAHVIYRLPGPIHLVAWQKSQWSKQLKGGAPQLWETYYEQPGHQSVLEALRLLRNTIHAEGLESVAVQESNRAVATWIELPRSDGQKIADAASQTAPLADWGIQILDTGTFIADPGCLMERLILSILNLLADVQAVLVADLQGLTETPAPRRGSILNSEAVARSHLALLGLGHRSTE